ncbi:MAG: UBP-type zinc finger domain-containing protein [bacterium]|nr:UBP-type zinc finger domain-containing protein [bacterium]
MPNQKIKKEFCPHLGEMKITSSEKKACEICGEKENLRLCTSCGSVFCCESHQAHNREHFQKTGHPIIIPLPTGTPYKWIWCWVCNAYLE